MRPFRISIAILRILEHLYATHPAEHYGLTLGQDTELGNGSLYPALGHLEEGGYVTARWETLEEKPKGRRRRKYYRLTDAGVGLAEEELRRSPTLPAPPTPVTPA